MGIPVSAIAVANTFLEFAKEEGRTLTHMELQKHTFFANGWYLGHVAEPLFPNEIQAWKWGPVIPTMYHAFKGFKNGPVTMFGVEFDRELREVVVRKVTDSNLVSFLRQVWEAYKALPAATLSQISHETGGPWHQFYREDEEGPVKNVAIDPAVIRDFYQRKIAALK